MKKIKFSVIEKRLIGILVLFLLIQFFIIHMIVYYVKNSGPVNVNDTIEVDITIENIYTVKSGKGSHYLVISSNSQFYKYRSNRSFDYTVSELYDSLSVGDRISVSYVEKDRFLFGKQNVIVGARQGDTIYRTIEEYNRVNRNIPVLDIILFSIPELIFLGFVFVYVWCNYSTIKGLYKKTKKRMNSVP